MKFNWHQDVSYNATAKAAFHKTAKSRLRALAKELGLAKGTYSIRSNMGGIAVSGEITLHHDFFYLQVFHTCFSVGDCCRILARSCNGQKDYSGGPNGWFAAELLDDIPRLADHVRARFPAVFPRVTWNPVPQMYQG